jgi:hypothetical protein
VFGLGDAVLVVKETQRKSLQAETDSTTQLRDNVSVTHWAESHAG